MQYNDRSHYLVTIDVENKMKIHKFQTYKFIEPFFTLKCNEIFLGKGQNYRVTKLSGAGDNPDFVGRNILAEITEKVDVFISGCEIIKFA